MPLQFTPSTQTAELWGSFANKPIHFEAINLGVCLASFIIGVAYSVARSADQELVTISRQRSVVSGTKAVSLVLPAISIAVSAGNLYYYATRCLSPVWTTVCATFISLLWAGSIAFFIHFQPREEFNASYGLFITMCGINLFAGCMQLVYLVFSGHTLRELRLRVQNRGTRELGFTLGLQRDTEGIGNGSFAQSREGASNTLDWESRKRSQNRLAEMDAVRATRELGGQPQPVEAQTHEIVEARSRSPAADSNAILSTPGLAESEKTASPSELPALGI